MAKMYPRKSFITLTILAIALLIAGVVVVVVFAMNRQAASDINSFQTCKDAGGAILESYPEQCSKNGKTFTNPEQSLNPSDDQAIENDAQDYVGLTEEHALSKASAANKAARVVQRDDEEMMITMDFSPGRLNLYVEDGKVVRVQVEGQE